MLLVYRYTHVPAVAAPHYCVDALGICGYLPTCIWLATRGPACWQQLVLGPPCVDTIVHTEWRLAVPSRITRGLVLRMISRYLLPDGVNRMFYVPCRSTSCLISINFPTYTLTLLVYHLPRFTVRTTASSTSLMHVIKSIMTILGFVFSDRPYTIG